MVKKFMCVADLQGDNYMVGIMKTKAEWQQWLIDKRVEQGHTPLIKIAKETTYDNILETIKDMYGLAFEEVELNDLFIFYDCDSDPKHFDDWFWAMFKVPNITDAERFFQGWLNEYFNSEKLMETTDRYSYIIKKAKELGYEYVPFLDCGGFGC